MASGAATVAAGAQTAIDLGSVDVSGRASYNIRVRPDRSLLVVARTADGRAEITSAPIATDSAVSWATLVRARILASTAGPTSEEIALQATVLARRSDSSEDTFVLHVADTAFAQIGVTMTPDELFNFVELLSFASIIGRSMSRADLALHGVVERRRVRAIQPTQQVPYPKSMRASSTRGEVKTQFVVDTEGRVDRSTFKILSSTHPDFSFAVRARLRHFEFVPAMIAGRPIRQMVRQSFIFRPAP